MKNNKKPLAIANWKLNHTKKDMLKFFDELLPNLDLSDDVNIVIAPVSTILDAASIKIEKSGLFLSAQNVFYQEGAYTGEYSINHLLELGVKYCLIGHSERRNLFHETDDEVNKKVLVCLNHDITPVICIGESKEQRKLNLINEVLSWQIKYALTGVEFIKYPIVIAYEPLWAIGTGVIPTEEEINNAVKTIRDILENLFNDQAKEVSILYGGSVNVQNIKHLVEKCDINGVLVGGASLQASSFLTIIKAVSNLKNK